MIKWNLLKKTIQCQNAAITALDGVSLEKTASITGKAKNIAQCMLLVGMRLMFSSKEEFFFR